MKKSIKFFLILITLAICFSCAGPKEFGPYKGKVVDKETNEPIEGAVVFMRFFILGSSVAGYISDFADAVEVLTDSRGEFIIPKSKMKSYRLFREWEPHGYVIIFKPGYGVYPDHKESGPRPLFKPNGTIPSDLYITFELPELKTKEERRQNLGYADVYHETKVAIEKQKEIIRLINIENKELGLGQIDPSKWR